MTHRAHQHPRSTSWYAFVAILCCALASSGRAQLTPNRDLGPKELNLSPAQKKIGTLLRVAAADIKSGVAVRPNSPARSGPRIRIDDRDRIQVYLDLAAVDAESVGIISRMGDVTIEIADPDLPLIQAWVPHDLLETIASLTMVKRIRRPEYATLNTGRVTTQGDSILKADQVRNTLSMTGAGVKVGVISDGANDAGSSQATGDLPSALTVFGGCDVAVTGTTCNEGTAILEIVHDLAPGATLAMGSTGVTFTSAEFNHRVTDLVNWGAKVIVDDLVFFEQPYFEDGFVARGYASALSKGVVMISSAGNFAQGHYQGQFLEKPGSRWHDFGGGDTTITFKVHARETAAVILQWSNPFGLSGDDYDLYVLDSDESTTVESSIDTQNGTQDPVEMTTVYCGNLLFDCTFNVAVSLFDGQSRTLELFILPGVFGRPGPVVTEHLDAADSIFGHAAVAGVISLAAISAGSTGSTTIEPYSSHGPSTIFFPSVQQRATPALSTIDCVSVTGAGHFQSNFCGTSAAAPHAAGIAALLLQVNPSLTPAQVKAAMQNTAADRGSAGFDSVFGSGLADALAATGIIGKVLVNRNTGPQGSSFQYSSLYFTPKGLVRIFVKRAGSLAWEETDVEADANGMFSWTVPAIWTGCAAPLGAYSVVVRDEAAWLKGDLNGDAIVNSLDWSLMNASWFKNDPFADINHDGIVNSIDFSSMNANWFKWGRVTGVGFFLTKGSC